MIFQRDLAEKVKRGEKTVTRRQMNGNPNSPWYRRSTRYQVGSTFAVQPGRGEPGICRARVTANYVQRLKHMREFDAWSEGFRPEGWASALYAFDNRWETINGSYDGDEEVRVIEFEVVKAP